jgi:type II secretory pathway component PulK
MMFFLLKTLKKYHKIQSERGVALIIVLLVTALLIALIFEFAYGTRVSLRASVNFRDSQRAYFLARSGLGIFVKYKELRDHLPQGDWGVVPVVSSGDAELRIRWEDEAGKINISGLRAGSKPFSWLIELFRQQSVSQENLDKIVETSNQLQLLTELHKFMKDEDYNKVAPYLTLYSTQKERININTASEQVLRSVLATNTTMSISQILSRRKDQPYTDAEVSTAEYGGLFVATGDVFKVYFFATVGGYIKQIESVVSNNTLVYWKAL